MNNLLNGSIGIISFLKPESGGFLVDIIAGLIGGVSSVALGIILFTLILKFITLPFDYFSRASMRKNSLKMEMMRPELERLQKQYANDKQLYNQKMMALYKKNGYSMMGPCLPTILTLVIFIVAINAFSGYSDYQNRVYYYQMATSYNNAIYAGVGVDNDYVKENENKEITINDEKFMLLLDNEKIDEKTFTSNNINYTVKRAKDDKDNLFYTIKSDKGYTDYLAYYSVQDGNYTFSNKQYTINGNNLVNDAENKNTYANEYNNFLKSPTGYYNGTDNAVDFVKSICRQKSADTFKPDSFLWIKNIWVADTPMAHPIEEKTTSINKQSGCGCGGETVQYITEAEYTELITNLSEEKTQPNGFFILIILNAGLSLLLQLITNKSQKAQMELQTVDGQGKQQQKMMMWMMPIMMGLFSLMYTSAFSIYIVMSTVISIASTVIINKIVDKKFKAQTETVSQKNKVIRGRVYVPEVKEEPKKEKRAKKAKEPEVGDFITGRIDKKKKR